MRKRKKRGITELIGTFQEAHREIRSCLDNGKPEEAGQLFYVCQEGISGLSSILEKEQGGSDLLWDGIDIYYRQLYEMEKELGKVPADTIFWNLEKTIAKIAAAVEKRFPVTYEILFLPYKASMWDSFESIWKEASGDPRCDCSVVPIPYYDVEINGQLGRSHYEAGLFSPEVRVKSFLEYRLEEQRPDVIYFHNPYDQFNRLTRVLPDYFSDRLKQYTDMLVFVPYYVEGSYLYEEARKIYYSLKAHMTSDLVVAQSEVQARFFIEGGCDKERVLTLGSPKLDAIVSHQSDDWPTEWNRTLEGRTVLLLNTSIATFLQAGQWLDMINEIFEWFEKHRECALIWRPHPLLQNSVKSMKPTCLACYENLVGKIISMENGLMDTAASPYPAIACSGALISDYSSLALQ